MKNWIETFRADIVTSAGNAEVAHGTVNSYDDIKIENSKITDTSSGANAFAGQTAGDVIKMTGWDDEENNRIFIITEVDGDGEWIKVDKEVKDATEPSSGGATIYTGSEELTLTGASTSDVIMDACSFNAAVSSFPESMAGKTNMRITAADTVTSFAVATAGDLIQIFWGDMSEG